VNIKNYNPYQFPHIALRYPDANTSLDRIRQTGYYLTSRFNITDPLKVIAGARQSSYESVDQYKKSNIFTPYLGLTYDINQALTAYASFTDTFVGKFIGRK